MITPEPDSLDPTDAPAPITFSRPLLAVDRLAVRLGRRDILAEVSFAVLPGRIAALIGPNGAGKTTLLNCLSGFVRPTSGQIRFHGFDLAALPAYRLPRAGIARSFQDPRLFNDISCLEYLLTAQHSRIPGSLLGDILGFPARWRERRARERARAVLAGIELGSMETALVGVLSRGQRKRLDLARCLAQGADLLLLDEPAGGLQPQEVEMVGRILRDLQAENPAVTMLIVEHNMRLVNQVADQVVVLDNGRVVVTGSPAEVREDPMTARAYLGAL